MTEYLRRSKRDQEPLVEVTFDETDGAIERVCLFCEISDRWLPIEGPLPAPLEAKLIEFINDWIQSNVEAV